MVKMAKYFILKNKQTLEVIITNDLEEQPENSIIFEENNFIIPCFNKYPNPTEIVEGVTIEILEKIKLEKIKTLNTQAYNELIVTDWYVTRFLETGKEIPIEIVEERNAIREKYNVLKENL
jgi:hypothetical protein